MLDPFLVKTMAEAAEQIGSRKLPLGETHARLGAVLIERDGWCVPASYGDVLLEYAAVRESGAGLIDLSSRGRILVSGTEAILFLNGLITNDMKTLAVNSWMPAAFPNVQGRLLASVRVVRLEDAEKGTDQTTPAGLPRRRPRQNVSPTFLIETEAATHQSVLKTIQRFTLAGDFHVSDITSQTALISVQGKRATGIVSAVLGETISGLGKNAARPWPASHRLGAPASCPPVDESMEPLAPGGNSRDRSASEMVCQTVIRATHTGEDGFDLIVDVDHAAELWEALQAADARPFGYEALEILRIEAGQPRYGVDMDETNVVSEALDDAVSYTKGCYIGQEIIARIKYRGHVAKKLSGIVFPQAAQVAAGSVVKSTDDKEIGRITSFVYSPHLGGSIALGYLKYDYTAPNTSVLVISGDKELPAQVIELPFVQNRER